MIQALLTNFIGPLVMVTLLIGCLIGINRLLARMVKGHPEKEWQKQTGMLIVSLLLVLLLLIALPISDSLRGQIMSLLGILLSAAIALSSTTFLGNALAGVLLRNVRSFSVGDFIYLNQHWGRVSARGLFHLEIQTEDRDLLTVPNLYVTNNPVKVIRGSGTIISTEVSLGYEVPRGQIEKSLLEAATAAGLENPFVYVISLGDFSVVYRVSGMLSDVKSLISSRSRLNGQVLDSLHHSGIEIVSPSFMNTRNVEQKVHIPKEQRAVLEQPPGSEPEEIIFDKAEQAESLEELKKYLGEIENRLAALKEVDSGKDEQARQKILKRVERLTKQREQLSSRISRGTEKLSMEK